MTKLQWPTATSAVAAAIAIATLLFLAAFQQKVERVEFAAEKWKTVVSQEGFGHRALEAQVEFEIALAELNAFGRALWLPPVVEQLPVASIPNRQGERR